jgi:hypothetical protein
MTEIPKNFDEYEKLFSFSTRYDDIGVWADPNGYTIEVTDGRRDAYYKVTKDDVRKLNVELGFDPDLDFIEMLKKIKAQSRAGKFYEVLRDNVKTDFVWFSGF